MYNLFSSFSDKQIVFAYFECISTSRPKVSKEEFRTGSSGRQTARSPLGTAETLCSCVLSLSHTHSLSSILSLAHSPSLFLSLSCTPLHFELCVQVHPLVLFLTQEIGLEGKLGRKVPPHANISRCLRTQPS